MDRGSILHSEMGPGVAFAIFLTFRGGGVHLPRRKVDLGGPLYTGGGSIVHRWEAGAFTTAKS